MLQENVRRWNEMDQEMDLLKNTQALLEKEIRVRFFDSLRRPPTKEERSMISELVSEHIRHFDIAL